MAQSNLEVSLMSLNLLHLLNKKANKKEIGLFNTQMERGLRTGVTLKPI